MRMSVAFLRSIGLPLLGLAALAGCGNLSGPPGASMSAQQVSVSVIQGEQVSDTLTITPQNGLAAQVDLNYTVYNSSGQQVNGFTFTPTSVQLSGTTQVTPSVTVASDVPTGTYTVKVQGSAGDAHFSAQFKVLVTPASATISSFTASSAAALGSSTALDLGFLTQPTDVTLNWQATNATGYQLAVSPSKGITGIPTQTISAQTNQETVTLPASTSASDVVYTFTLTADGPGGSSAAVNQTLTVTVGPYPAPAISSFMASLTTLPPSAETTTTPVTAQPVVLSWNASNAASYDLALSGSGSAKTSGVSAVSGVSGSAPWTLSASATSATFTFPPNTTSQNAVYTFTLTALGIDGNANATSSVSVTVAPVTTGTITVALSGIPTTLSSGNLPQIALSGPSSYSQTLSDISSQSFSGLTPGNYTLSAPGFTGVSGNKYTAALAGGTVGSGSETLTVSAAQTTDATIAYTTQTTALNLGFVQPSLISSYAKGLEEVQISGGGLTAPLLVGPSSSEPVFLPASSSAQTYTLTAGTLRGGSFYAGEVLGKIFEFQGALSNSSLSVTAGGSYSDTATYQAVTTAATVTVSGLNSVSSANLPTVVFSGPSGASFTYGTGNFSGPVAPASGSSLYAYLAPGNWQLQAPNFKDQYGNLYSAVVHPSGQTSLTADNITPFSATYSTQQGQLVIQSASSSALPSGTAAVVVVSSGGTTYPGISGVGSFNVPAASSGTSYTITPQPITAGGYSYTAQPVSVVVPNGGTVTASVNYQPATGNLDLNVSGLPTGLSSGQQAAVNAQVTVASGTTSDSQTLSDSTAQLSFTGLPASSSGVAYSLTAAPFQVPYSAALDSVAYLPTITTPVTVTAGQTATDTLSYAAQALALSAVSPTTVTLPAGGTADQSVTLVWTAANVESYSFSAGPSSGVQFGQLTSTSVKGQYEVTVSLPPNDTTMAATYQLTVTADGAGGQTASLNYSVSVSQLGGLDVSLTIPSAITSGVTYSLVGPTDLGLPTPPTLASSSDALGTSTIYSSSAVLPGTYQLIVTYQPISTYVVQASPTSGSPSGGNYIIDLTVTAGNTTSETVSYAPVSPLTGSATLSVSGLPSSLLEPAPNVTLDNSSGKTVGETSSGNTVNPILVNFLAPGTYTLNAQNYTDQYGNVYNATLTPSSATVSAQTTTAFAATYATQTGQLIVGSNTCNADTFTLYLGTSYPSNPILADFYGRSVGSEGTYHLGVSSSTTATSYEIVVSSNVYFAYTATTASGTNSGQLSCQSSLTYPPVTACVFPVYQGGSTTVYVGSSPQ